MAKKQDSNKVINGTFGTVWIDTERFANCKSFECKISMDYADITFAEDLSTHKKYLGWSGAGTITLHKVDSAIAKKLAESVKKGTMVPATIVAKLEDPASYGAERVQLSGVYFDELMLLKFTTKEAQEESIPFTFDDYEFLEYITEK